MDTEDRIRTLSNKEKVFRLLRQKGVVTNTEIRAVGGARGMARVFELKQELGADVIQVRKLRGSTWEIRYQQAPLGRSAETPAAPPGLLFERHPGPFQR